MPVKWQHGFHSWNRILTLFFSHMDGNSAAEWRPLPNPVLFKSVLITMGVVDGVTSSRAPCRQWSVVFVGRHFPLPGTPCPRLQNTNIRWNGKIIIVSQQISQPYSSYVNDCNEIAYFLHYSNLCKNWVINSGALRRKRVKLLTPVEPPARWIFVVTRFCYSEGGFTIRKWDPGQRLFWPADLSSLVTYQLSQCIAGVHTAASTRQG